MTTPIAHIPTLETERLILRAPMIEDFPAVRAFMAGTRSAFVGGPDEDEFTCWRAFMGTLGHWHLRGHGFFMLEERATGRPAGRVGVVHHVMWPEPELGWHVFDGFEGQGYAFEAAVAARDWAARERGLDRLCSNIAPDNARSLALAKRLGAAFERVGELLGEPCHVYRHPSVLEGAA